MRIKSLGVQNFKALEQISMANTQDINVIVGPNAIGKSTLLEVIRLPKVLLAGRIQNEGQSVLVQMGALSPHHQVVGGTGLDIGSLANKPELPILLKLEITLSEEEVGVVNSEIHNIAFMLLHSETVNSSNEKVLDFTQYLSTKPGQEKLVEKINDAKTRLAAILPAQPITLELIMIGSQGLIRGTDVFNQSIITILDRRLPNHKTMFSMFPADRSFPQGEQPLQVGSADAQNQLMSHMAQPSTKYARLKQTIIHNILLAPEGRELIVNEFNLIFDNLLPGKKLAGINISPLGLIKILVHDIHKNKVFDIDQMSSGEKGLVLTFLFLRLTMQHGGVVLLDEPELHLNAAVQAKIIPFIIEHCIKPLSVQVFLCTHSPEIVKDAYDSERCGLFHLRAGNDLTPILKQDHHELFDVFDRLGSSPADVLFSRGNIYVEGDHDSQIFQAGYPRLLEGFQITQLGGRAEIEREVPIFQAEEKSGKLRKVQLFILDNDREKMSLKSTDLVKVKQLNRYCIENFLINADIMYDLILTHKGKDKPLESRGAFSGALKEIAFLQIPEIVMKIVYPALSPESPGIRNKDCEGRNFEIAADILLERLNVIKAFSLTFDQSKWKADFISACRAQQGELEVEWASKWITQCSGKVLIDDLYVRYEIHLKKVEFKKAIIKKMAEQATEEWNTLYGFLSPEIS
jgi:predicted ATPase